MSEVQGATTPSSVPTAVPLPLPSSTSEAGRGSSSTAAPTPADGQGASGAAASRSGSPARGEAGTDTLQRSFQEGQSPARQETPQPPLFQYAAPGWIGPRESVIRAPTDAERGRWEAQAIFELETPGVRFEQLREALETGSSAYRQALLQETHARDRDLEILPRLAASVSGEELGRLTSGLHPRDALALAEAIAKSSDTAEKVDFIRPAPPETYAARVAELLGSEEATLEDWGALARVLEPEVESSEFAAKFYNALGPEETAGLPYAIQRAWAGEDGRSQRVYGRDTQGAWEALTPFSRMLATASHHVAQPGDPLRIGDQEGRLESTFVHELLGRFDAKFHEAGFEGRPSHVGLLFAAGGFSDDFLLPLAAFAEEALPVHPRMGEAYATTLQNPWGAYSSRPAAILPALAESPVAAGSQPRLLAQLITVDALSAADLDIAMLEAARRAHEDPAFGAVLAEEAVALGLGGEEHIGEFVDELQAMGLALAGARVTRAAIQGLQAGRDTVQGLENRASTAGRQLSMHPDPAMRSAAARALRDTPGWLRNVVNNRGYQLTRGLPAAGLGVSLLGHLAEGRDVVESTARASGGFAGAWLAGKATAKLVSPLLAKGPPGWAAYSGAVLVAGVFGGLAGERIASGAFGERPEDWLWVAPQDGGGLRMPSPPE